MKQIRIYENNDAKENGFKESVLSILEIWIRYNRKNERYIDCLTMCKEMISLFDSNCEFYADAEECDIVRHWIDAYEKANEMEFKRNR